LRVSSFADPPKGFLVAAHYHHAVRTDSADADQAFVADLAKKLGVRFVTEKATRASADEASMRTVRRDFLIRTAKATGARYIALAHSADDNVETVLQNLMRGTGPAGIAGMPIARPIDNDLVLVRPMIGVSSIQIRDHLRSIDQPWREDESNTNTDYGRNWIRHELLPMIRSRYPRAEDAIARAAESSAKWRDVIDRLADDWVERHVLEFASVAIRVDMKTETAIVVAGLQKIWDQQGWPRGDMTRDHWLRVAAAIAGEANAPESLPGKITLKSNSQTITLHSPKP
jgi:tRNA(Ile)-lysidine synthase